MFTGIIKATANVLAAKKKNGSLFLEISRPVGWRIYAGDSICADGVCLTVKIIRKKSYVTELMPETLDKTTFGVQIPKKISLEQSLRLADRLDGHFVLGHVDTTGWIESIKPRANSKIYKINFPAHFSKLLAEKGSITVDGVSLTVVEVGKNWFSVSLVGYTLKHTVLGTKKAGQPVNLEFDALAKYVNKLLSHRGK